MLAILFFFKFLENTFFVVPIHFCHLIACRVELPINKGQAKWCYLSASSLSSHGALLCSLLLNHWHRVFMDWRCLHFHLHRFADSDSCGSIWPSFIKAIWGRLPPVEFAFGFGTANWHSQWNWPKSFTTFCAQMRLHSSVAHTLYSSVYCSARR